MGSSCNIDANEVQTLMSDFESYKDIIPDADDPSWGDLCGPVSTTKPARKKVVFLTQAAEDRVKETNRMNAQKSRDAKTERDRLCDLEIHELQLEHAELGAFKTETMAYVSQNDIDANFMTLNGLLYTSDL
ncbi:hypothetical protein T484DRAFT_1757018 [Baffinella frigidus]|nr:hypothetical protein T484DRAFT_1757018 [Cryptophyta sp. CCMP2293]